MTDIKQKTLLLVEDEAIIAIIQARQLEQEGYRVVRAASGEKAIEIICRENVPVDLILMDIDLGEGIDGTDTAREILKNHNIPVVFLSSHTEKEVVQKTEKITSYGYVVKDSGITVLDASIKMAFKLFNANTDILIKENVLSILNEIITVANAAYDLPSLFTNILEGSMRLLDYDAGGIYLLDPDGCHARVVHSCNLPADFLKEVETVSPDHEQYRDIFKNGMPVITDHYERMSPGKAQETGFRSLVSVPLYSKNHVTGVLNVLSRHRYVVTEDEKSTLIAIGRELGTIIERITAETEVKKAAENIRTLFNSVGEMVFILDMNCNIIQVNDTVTRRLLYSHDELVDRDVLFLHPPERREEAARIVHDIIAGVTDQCEIPLLAKDGTLIEVETKISHAWWDNREVMISVSRDITERKKTERALEEADLKFRTIFDFASDGFLGVWVDSLRFSIANTKICEMLGYAKEELLKLSIPEIHHESSMPYVMNQFKKLLSKEISIARNIPLMKKSGEIFFSDVSASPIVLEGKDFILGLFRDITDHKEAEGNIQLIRDRLNYALHTVNIGAWELNLENLNAWRSLEHDEIFGYKTLLPDWNFNMFISHVIPEDRDYVKEKYQDAKSTGTEWNFECRIIRTDGALRWILAKGNTRYDKNNKPVAMFGIVQDITGRKQAEEQIKYLLNEKELILKEVHHRIKNNMNTVTGLLTLAAGSLDNQEAKSILYDSAGRIRSMMLLYDRLYRSENTGAVPVQDYIPSLVSEIIGNFTEKGSVKIETQIEDITLGVNILSPLGMIINELITNSMKYAFEGRTDRVISVTVSRKNGRISVIFEDNGCGIPEYISFNSSSGFGLQLVDILVNQIDGSVSLERQRGTRFVIEFEG